MRSDWLYRVELEIDGAFIYGENGRGATEGDARAHGRIAVERAGKALGEYFAGILAVIPADAAPRRNDIAMRITIARRP